MEIGYCTHSEANSLVSLQTLGVTIHIALHVTHTSVTASINANANARCKWTFSFVNVNAFAYCDCPLNIYDRVGLLDSRLQLPPPPPPQVRLHNTADPETSERGANKHEI